MFCEQNDKPINQFTENGFHIVSIDLNLLKSLDKTQQIIMLKMMTDELILQTQVSEINIPEQANQNLLEANAVADLKNRQYRIPVNVVLKTDEMFIQANTENMKKGKSFYIAADNIKLTSHFVDIAAHIISHKGMYNASLLGTKAKQTKADNFALNIGPQLKEMREIGQFDKVGKIKPMTLEEIADNFNKNAIPTATGNAKWGANTVKRVYERYLSLIPSEPRD
jgi:hypothetical protein